MKVPSITGRMLQVSITSLPIATTGIKRNGRQSSHFVESQSFVCSISHYAITCQLASMRTNANYLQHGKIISTRRTQSQSSRLISLPRPGRAERCVFVGAEPVYRLGFVTGLLFRRAESFRSLHNNQSYEIKKIE